MDIEEMLKSMINKEGREKSFHNCESDARDELDEFREVLLKRGDLKVGDYVVRNKQGLTRYQFPNKSQAAMITKVFDHPMTDDENCLCDAEMTVCLAKGEIRNYLISTMYYKKSGGRGNIIAGLFKKGE